MIAWSLAGVSVLWGLAAFLVFRRLTDQVALRRVRKRLYAHLLEIRLYAEEPSLVWKAQRGVVAENFHFFALIWKPILILAIAFALLYGPLDSVYGWAPLPVGRSALVTLYPADSAFNDGTQYTLLAPSGIVVETPAVRVMDEREVSWRIRPVANVGGRLVVRFSDGRSASRTIVAGEGSLSHNQRRESERGWEWMEVDYPPARVTIAGLSLHWVIWFAILSTASAGLPAVWPSRKKF